ncbi:MAG: DNA repair exonuclease [Mobilitalea sp.]
MKFIHIADVHLGAVPDSNQAWGVLREKEIWSSFQNIINICNEEDVDLLLIAGDLFHKQPLLRELKEANYYLSKLKTTKVILMAGNHDYISPRSHYQDFEWDERVYMFLSASMGAVTLPDLNVTVYGLSYCSRDITEPMYDFVRPKDTSGINILLAHGGDEKNIPMNRRKMLELGFDYIALGHIHKPELINERMAYSGSLEPMDRNETGARGYVKGEINTDQEARRITLQFIPSSLREYKNITLGVNQETTNGSLLDEAREIVRSQGNQHIYSFCIEGIRDEDLQFNKEALKGLGNILEVIDNSIPDYDFDALYRENSDNMIGQFIKRIREHTSMDDLGMNSKDIMTTKEEITRKALYYGIEALLGAKN